MFLIFCFRSKDVVLNVPLEKRRLNIDAVPSLYLPGSVTIEQPIEPPPPPVMMMPVVDLNDDPIIRSLSTLNPKLKVQKIEKRFSAPSGMTINLNDDPLIRSLTALNPKLLIKKVETLNTTAGSCLNVYERRRFVGVNLKKKSKLSYLF